MGQLSPPSIAHGETCCCLLRHADCEQRYVSTTNPSTTGKTTYGSIIASTRAQHLWRYLHDHYDLTIPRHFHRFATADYPNQSPASGIQLPVSYTWLITPTLINEAKINASWNGQRIPPVGEFWKSETSVNLSTTFLRGRFDNGIPNTSFPETGRWPT